MQNSGEANFQRKIALGWFRADCRSMKYPEMRLHSRVFSCIYVTFNMKSILHFPVERNYFVRYVKD